MRGFAAVRVCENASNPPSETSATRCTIPAQMKFWEAQKSPSGGVTAQPEISNINRYGVVDQATRNEVAECLERLADEAEWNPFSTRAAIHALCELAHPAK